MHRCFSHWCSKRGEIAIPKVRATYTNTEVIEMNMNVIILSQLDGLTPDEEEKEGEDEEEKDEDGHIQEASTAEAVLASICTQP